MVNEELRQAVANRVWHQSGQERYWKTWLKIRQMYIEPLRESLKERHNRCTGGFHKKRIARYIEQLRKLGTWDQYIQERKP